MSNESKQQKQSEPVTPERPKRSLAVFTQKFKKGESSRFDQRISLDADRITKISISKVDGSTLVLTKDGVIPIQESFEEANRIWANA